MTTKKAKQLGWSSQNDMFTRFIKSELKLDVSKEYSFHPTRKWRFDYAIVLPTGKVAIEVEGGVWTNGRHTRGKGFIADMEKYNEATARGWKLIRVTPDQLLTQKTLNLIVKCLDYEKKLTYRVP